MSKPHPFKAFTIIELTTTLCIVMLLIMLLIPAVVRARQTARSLQCQNNLVQFGIALENYRLTSNVLPPGTVNATGPIDNSDLTGYQISWLARILPFLDQQSLYRHIDFSQGAYADVQESAREMGFSTLHCPSAPPLLIASTAELKIKGDLFGSSYASCYSDRETPIDADNDGVFFLNSSIRLRDVSDGLSHTVFVGEKSAFQVELGWMAGNCSTLRNMSTLRPSGATAYFGLGGTDEDAAAATNGGFGGAHGKGVPFLMGDGNVRYIDPGIDAKIRKALGNRKDGVLFSSF